MTVSPAAMAAGLAAVRGGDLADFYASGRWRARRPGVIVARYNGDRDNGDVFRSLLDRHGLVGWFFVVTGVAGLASEIVGAQADRRRELCHPVRAFAGLSGDPYGATPVADALVDCAGYEFVFSNLKVQRRLRRGRLT